MKKVIIVFTNNSSLQSIGIEKHITRFPQEIIINRELSVFLLSDSENNPNLLKYVNTHFEEIYIVYHTNGSVDKEKVAQELNNKLKGSLTLSHIENSGNYYNEQVRKLLELVPNDAPTDKPWDLTKVKKPDGLERFMIEPFDNNGLEIKYELLLKIMVRAFDKLTEEEKALLNENHYEIKSVVEKGQIDWTLFNNLRDKLFKDL